MSAISAIPGFVPRCRAQSAADSPPVAANKAAGRRFEVASVRLAPDPASVITSGKVPHLGTKIVGDRVDIGSISLMSLFCTAYSISWPDRVSGPAWMMTQRFDVLAKLPAGATKDQLPELLQVLLEERFKLTFHRTASLASVYVMLVGPRGHKLEPAIPEDPQSGPDEKAGPPHRAAFGGSSGTFSGVMRNGPNGTQRVSMSNGVIHTEFYGISTKGLGENFAGRLGRPVIDMTGLEGTYHVVFDYSASHVSPSAGNATEPAAPAGDQNPGSSVMADPPLVSVFAAVEKLGLKLESRKVSLEGFVIDHIEKLPTEN